MHDHIKNSVTPPTGLSFNPILDYFKEGLVDLVLEYLDRHKDEIWKIVMDVLKGALKKHPELKSQVAALLGDHGQE